MRSSLQEHESSKRDICPLDPCLPHDLVATQGRSGDRTNPIAKLITLRMVSWSFASYLLL